MSIRRSDSNCSSRLDCPSHFPRKVRLIIREEACSDNLFARLSPGLAHDLLRRIHCSEEESFSGYPVRRPNGWTHLDEDVNVSISFLPLSISDGNSTVIYASYNGGTCGLSSEQESIELPRSIVSDRFKDVPEYVSVHSLSNIEYAASVHVEPANVEDWELLEIYSGFMENGGLLRQVSVVYPNQLLTLRIGGIDRVKVTVKEFATGRSLKPNLPSVSSDSFVSDNRSRVFSKEQSISQRCALLIQDTEVIVSPKTRLRKKMVSWSKPLRLIPSDSDWGASYDKLSKLTETESFHVEPGFVLVHCNQWPFETKWAQLKVDECHANDTRLVGVTTSSRIPQNNAVLFIGTRLDLRATLFKDRVCLRPLMSTREVSMESITLEILHLQYNKIEVPAWNVADIDLATYHEMCYPDWLCQNTQHVLPVGAVIPIPSTHVTSDNIDFSDQWFRITSEEADDRDEGCIVQLNTDDFSLLSKRLLARSTEFSSLSISSRQTPQAQIPRETIVSSNWLTPIIDRVKYFTTTFVTLCGVNGSGKTHHALFLSALMSFYFHRPTFYLDCRKLQKSKPRMSEILKELDSVFAQAREERNAIIVLDDIDVLSPNLFIGDENIVSEGTHAVNPAAIDQSKLIADRLSHLCEAAYIEGIKSKHCHLSLIATCLREDSMNSSILQSSQFPIIHAKVPHMKPEDQGDLVMAMIRRYHPRIRKIFDNSKISGRTEGFIPRDFEKLCLRAIRSYIMNPRIGSLTDSFVAELDDFTPIARISNSGPDDSNHTLWSDIGGLFHVKEKLEATVRHPILYHHIYSRARIELPRGILLYGPPGCGKSYLVPALARECNYPLVTCKGPEVLDKYIGASEAKVRELFERASQMAPSILFLDELEALAPRRGSDSTGVTDRVVNQLLTFLDGVENVSSGTVFIVGATSRPDKVDPAIIRPGRLEQHLYVGPPESTKEWSDLFIKISKQWNLKPETLDALMDGEEIPKMANDVPRLCPADIRAAFDTAHLNAVHRFLAGEATINDDEKIEMGVEDIKFGLRETKASLSESEAKILKSLYSSLRGHIQSNSSRKCIHEQKISLR